MATQIQPPVNLESRVRDLRDGWGLISLVGDADLYSTPSLRDRLLGSIDGGAKTIVVDLTGVTFIDSTMLGVLVQARKRVEESGGRIAIVCHDPNVLRVLSITALDRLFDVYPSADEATRRLGLDGDASLWSDGAGG